MIVPPASAFRVLPRYASHHVLNTRPHLRVQCPLLTAGEQEEATKWRPATWCGLHSTQKAQDFGLQLLLYTFTQHTHRLPSSIPTSSSGPFRCSSSYQTQSVAITPAQSRRNTSLLIQPRASCPNSPRTVRRLDDPTSRHNGRAGIYGCRDPAGGAQGAQ
jgi:hypothetical protein